MAYGRSNYGRYGGWNNLAAGQRGLYGNPQGFVQGMLMGYQSRDPRMAEKIARKKLEIAAKEKEIVSNLQNYFTIADVDMTAINENDIPALTDHLSQVKRDWYKQTEIIAKIDDPIKKAEAQAEFKKMQNNITSVYAGFAKYKEYQRFGKDGFHDFSKHNMDEYELFLSLVDPNAERTIVDGELKITGHDGKQYSINDLEDIIPSYTPIEGIHEIDGYIDNVLKNKTTSNMTPDQGNLYNDFSLMLKKAYNRDKEDDNNEVVRGMMTGNYFGDGTSFLDSNRFDAVQKEWEAMKGKGLWINASDEDYHALQKRIADNNNVEGLGTLGHEFADWGSKEVLNSVKDTKYTPPPSDTSTKGYGDPEIYLDNIIIETAASVNRIMGGNIGGSGVTGWEGSNAETPVGTAINNVDAKYEKLMIGKTGEELDNIIAQKTNELNRIHKDNQTARRTAKYLNSQLGLNTPEHKIHAGDDAYQFYTDRIDQEYKDWKEREEQFVANAISREEISGRTDANFEDKMANFQVSGEYYKDHMLNKPETTKLTRNEWEKKYIGYKVDDTTLIEITHTKMGTAYDPIEGITGYEDMQNVNLIAEVLQDKLNIKANINLVTWHDPNLK